MLLDFLEWREVSVCIVGDDKLVMAALRTNCAVRSEFDDLNRFAGAISTFSGHLEI